MLRFIYTIEDTCELAADRTQGRLSKSTLTALATFFAILGDTMNPRVDLKDLFTQRN